MKFILCIETSTEICSVAISGDGKPLAEVTLSEVNSHSEKLTGLIKRCLHDADLNLDQLHAIAISDGPGSYTGLRVGTGVAKGLCFALNIPLVAVPSLKSLAAGIPDTSVAHIMPMIDARRMEVYAAIYDNQLREVYPTNNLIITKNVLEDLAHQYGPLAICGNGAVKSASLVRELESIVVLPTLANARFMCGLAFSLYSTDGLANYVSYRPNYHKAPNITVSKTLL